MPDPIDNFLEDLGRARGRVRTDLARLPGSDPLLTLLKEVDRIISRTETDIRAAKNVAQEAMVQQYSSIREESHIKGIWRPSRQP